MANVSGNQALFALCFTFQIVFAWLIYPILSNLALFHSQSNIKRSILCAKSFYYKLVFFQCNTNVHECTL